MSVFCQVLPDLSAAFNGCVARKAVQSGAISSRFGASFFVNFRRTLVVAGLQKTSAIH